MGDTDIIGIIESAYRVRDDDAAWVRHLAAVVKPHLASGIGFAAAAYDRAQRDPRAMLDELVIDGFDPRLLGAMRSAFESGSDADRARSLGGGPAFRLSDLEGTAIRSSKTYGALAREIGFDDVLAVRAGNPDGTGIVLAAPTRAKHTRAWSRRWSRIAAHIAAGLRVQRASTTLTDLARRTDAVLSPGGRIIHASERARGASHSLKDAVVAIDRARTKKGRRDADAALDMWTVLVDGRWSLVDHFETDGRRYVLALENTPTAPDPRALTAEERPVLHFVLMGHTNKAIAYELGLPEGTVATRLAAIVKKLRAKSRVDLAARYFMLRRAETTRVEVGGKRFAVATASDVEAKEPSLTRAEREVAGMVAAGLGMSVIATKRRCAPRTVANILQSIYRKLGVRSQSELVTALVRLSTP